MANCSRETTCLQASRLNSDRPFGLRILLIACSLLLSIFTAQFAFAQTGDPLDMMPARSPNAVKPRRGKQPAKTASQPATPAVAPTPIPVSNLTIAKIDIDGNHKIEKDAILARLKSSVKGPYTSELIKEDVVQLFKSGYFYNVQVLREINGSEVNVLYRVTEKPTIAELIFEGNSELKTEELQESSGLKTYEILDQAKIRDAVEKIQKQYEDKGFFLAKIEPQIEDVKPGETVKVTIKITENDKVKVKQITFLGNHRIKDGTLKDRMATKEGGYFSFLSGSGSYKQDAFDRDMQILRFLYFNEGFVQVKIDRPQVYVTPDKKTIYITIRIDEGEQFDVGDIDFAGDLLFGRDELTTDIQINKRTVFSYEVLQKDLSILQAKYGDLGYAYANVIPRTRVNEKERKVDITFEFDKGNKVYFGNFTVVGNSKTRDKVVRRELRVHEGELYNETRKRKSLENIQRLGFFDDVTFKTSAPPDQPDVMNVDIVVKERNTGSIQLGAGYGSATGFQLQGSVNQTNFLGKGEKLGAGLNLNKLSKSANLNFTEPHYNDTDWSLGFDAYKSHNDRYDYYEDKLGGDVRLGHPITDEMNASIRYKYDFTDLSTEDGTTPASATWPNGYTYQLTDPVLFPIGTASGGTSSVMGILEYDSRNDRFSPSNGVFASGSLEYAGLGGSLKYSRGSTVFRYFKKLFWEVVWRNNATYSAILPNSGEGDVPFNELYLLGGPNSLRGYEFNRVGRTRFSQNLYDRYMADPNGAAGPNSPGFGYTDPNVARDAATRPFGGRQQVLFQTEFEFPLIAEAGIKGVTFFDIGAADDQISSDGLYSDVGFGFRWFSPIGPLRFEWGFPLRQIDTSPNPVQFEFSIGSPF